MTGVDFHAQAAEQLRAEDDAAFQRRVRERARRLEEERRRLTVTDFPTDPAACRARLIELQARHGDLAARQQNPLVTLSAAEDDELRVLASRIYELGKRVRQLDRAEGKAA